MRSQLDEVGFGIEPVPGELRGYREPIRGEGACLDEYFRAPAGRPEETGEHEMQVGGE